MTAAMNFAEVNDIALRYDLSSRDVIAAINRDRPHIAAYLAIQCCGLVWPRIAE